MNRIINIIGFAAIGWVVLMVLGWGLIKFRAEKGGSNDPRDGAEAIHRALHLESERFSLPMEAVTHSWSNGWREHTCLYLIELGPTEIERFERCLSALESTKTAARFSPGNYLARSDPPVWWNYETIDSQPYISGSDDRMRWRATFVGDKCYLVISDY